jgi:DNA polymerase-3 subunit delta
MTPAQFLERLDRQGPPAVCLFVGAEAYLRDRCRRALIERALAPELREAGYTRHDLDEVSLAEVVDDARSLSLFAPKRVIWANSAEALLGRTARRGSREEPDEALALLERYASRPSPGVVLAFEAGRYDYEGEGRKRLERLQEMLSFIRDQVVLARLDANEARRLAAELAATAGLRLGQAELALLVEATGGEAVRIAAEIEKLSLYAGRGGSVTVEEIARLVPSAQATTIFALVSALGRGDRRTAFSLLDLLVRQGEYLPLALAFLNSLFRHALVAREAGLRSPPQIQAHFSRLGVAMWPARAREIAETAATFSPEALRAGLVRIHEADQALRDARPDDRIVMERLVLALTA